MPERLCRVPRAALRETAAPLGHDQHTLSETSSTSSPRLGGRVCLRKGCGDVFPPRRWNQRYCGAPECRRELQRWQAAKRQQKRRSRPEVRQQHAAAERQRRARRRAAVEPSQPPKGRGRDGAWSRSKKISRPFCDRPGCYEPRRPAVRSPVRYCGDDCGQDVRRVLDRERKWLRRNRPAGRLQRRWEYETRRRRRRGDSSRIAEGSFPCGSDAVRNYRDREAGGLSCRGSFPEDPADDRKEAARGRPRPPPS